jgi:hypothetical protein
MPQEKWDEELIEKLADIEHQRWADWQNYVHQKLKYRERINQGERTAWYVLDPIWYERWEKLIDQDYSELSEKEKDSDREQVARYWLLIQEVRRQAKLETLEEARGWIGEDSNIWGEQKEFNATQAILRGMELAENKLKSDLRQKIDEEIKKLK